MCYRKFDHSDVDTNMHIERYACSHLHMVVFVLIKLLI